MTIWETGEDRRGLPTASYSAVRPTKTLPRGTALASENIAESAGYFGSSDAKSGCGRAITSAMISLPPSRSTVALPVSIAV